MKPQRRRRGEQAGFTLVELMMVIVIIAILVAILVPTLNGAIEYVNAVRCQSNLKQIAIAVLAYTTDQQGLIPAAKYDPVAAAASGNPALAKKYSRPLYWSNILVLGGYLSAPNTAKQPAGVTASAANVFRCPSGEEIMVNLDAKEAPTPNDPATALGFVREGDTKHAIDCWYFWNGDFGDRDATTPSGETYCAAFPSNTVPLRSSPATAVFHNISEIKSRTRLIMAADGLGILDRGKADAWTRITARHPSDNGPRTRTFIVFYDAHTDAIDRAPGDQNDWAGDTIRAIWVKETPPTFYRPVSGPLWRLDDR